MGPEPGWHGDLHFAPTGGVDKAKELTWTGRLVTGGEAVTLGVATRLAEDPLREELALAREIADRSADVARVTKRLLSASLDRSPAEQFPDEADVASLIGRPNQVEAVRAQLEGRAPDFTDA